jgi:hypothetical protein
MLLQNDKLLSAIEGLLLFAVLLVSPDLYLSCPSCPFMIHLNVMHSLWRSPLAASIQAILCCLTAHALICCQTSWASLTHPFNTLIFYQAALPVISAIFCYCVMFQPVEQVSDWSIACCIICFQSCIVATIHATKLLWNNTVPWSVLHSMWS